MYTYVCTIDSRDGMGTSLAAAVVGVALQLRLAAAVVGVSVVERAVT